MSDVSQHILSLFPLDLLSEPPPADQSSPAPGPADATTLATDIAREKDLPSLATLRIRVADILAVFDDPRYAHLDVPDWVPRAAPLAHHVRPTIRGLINAVCDAAAELGLLEGERYVLETVCACAATGLENIGVPSTPKPPTESETRELEGAEAQATGEALAQRLQHLASAWVAFLLWPYAVRIFKHPLVVYRDVYDHNKRRESVLLSLEVLRRFCELDSSYVDVDAGSAGVMDDPANMLSLCCTAHTKFDAFGLCFCAHTYKLADHDPRSPTLPPAFHESTSTSPPVPRTVTFQDLDLAPGSASSPPSARAALPSRSLLRAHAALGSVLYANSAALARIFERIEEPMARERPDVRELPVPDPDGASFWGDLVVRVGDVDEGHPGQVVATAGLGRAGVGAWGGASEPAAGVAHNLNASSSSVRDD
uniref:Polyamine oxidase (EC) n=1 Tax=Ganoderma boninense TaxID=34458 RepID=A0A5K1K1Z9_9APHY|nr:Polyamine oxidase (EC [Ganoderma boninense]